MGDRSEQGPDRRRIHRPSSGGVPLVFREEPSRTRRLLDRLRSLFRTGGREETETPSPAPEDSGGVAAAPAPAGSPGAGLRPPDPAPAPRPPGTAPRREEGRDRPTLQLLPGRLEPMDPEAIRQEVRFLRIPDPSRGVTLGWSDGAPPYHVMLHHPSIQPRHARMRFQDGQWWIENLSPEDPLMLNGQRLPVAAPPRALEDGDTVRLGRADFIFRMP